MNWLRRLSHNLSVNNIPDALLGALHYFAPEIRNWDIWTTNRYQPPGSRIIKDSINLGCQLALKDKMMNFEVYISWSYDEKLTQFDSSVGHKKLSFYCIVRPAARSTRGFEADRDQLDTPTEVALFVRDTFKGFRDQYVVK